MKRILLAGAAVMALSSASYAADLGYAPEPVPVDIWSGFFVGIQGGYAFKDLDVTVDADPTDSVEADDFIGGLYYGRNWQSGNLVFGLDSSINYLGLEEDGVTADLIDVEANFLGLSRLKVGYAFDNVLLFVAGGLATTWLDVEDPATGEDDDSFAFGFTVGAGAEMKFDEHWSGRIEYAYFNIEDDDTTLPDGDVDVEIDGHIVRAGVAYHF